MHMHIIKHSIYTYIFSPVYICASLNAQIGYRTIPYIYEYQALQDEE